MAVLLLLGPLQPSQEVGLILVNKKPAPHHRMPGAAIFRTSQFPDHAGVVHLARRCIIADLQPPPRLRISLGIVFGYPNQTGITLPGNASCLSRKFGRKKLW